MKKMKHLLLVYFFYVTALSLFTKVETKDLQQLEATSRGSDCHCRCLLTTEDAGPCPGKFGLRKIQYSVETISGGKDCHCSCTTPAPPNVCESSQKSSVESRDNEVFSFPLFTDEVANKTHGATSGSLASNKTLPNKSGCNNVTSESYRHSLGVNLMKLRSNVRSMVLALADMEQALTTSIPKEIHSIRQNIDKVGTVLETMKGSKVLQAIRKEIHRLKLVSQQNSTMYSTRSKWTTSPSNQTTTLNATGELVAAGHAPTTDAPTLSGEVRFSSNVRDDIQENDIFYQFLNIFEIEEIKSTDETTDLQSTSHSSVVTKESYRVTSSTFESDELFDVNGELVTSSQNVSSNPPLLFHQQKNVYNVTRLPKQMNSTLISDDEDYFDYASTPAMQPGQRTKDDITIKSISSGDASNTETTVPDHKSVTAQSDSHHDITERPSQDSSDSSSDESSTTTPQSSFTEALAVESFTYGYGDFHTTQQFKLKNVSDSKKPSVDAQSSNNEKSGSSEHMNIPSTATEAAAQQTVYFTPVTENRDSTNENYHTASGDRSSSDNGLDDADTDYYDYQYTYDSETTTAAPREQTTTTSSSTDVCGTLYNLSLPLLVHDFGRREGSWMMDPVPRKGQRNKIYLTNFFYGNSLLEFKSMARFKNFRLSNSYMLPYNWIGTGHMVYNGSFYYNRAFSRNIIKYNIRRRYVSAWGHLRNAVYDSTRPFSWQGQTMVHMTADEYGLYVVYPAHDEYDPYSASPAYVINKINPHDLKTIGFWKTSMRSSANPYTCIKSPAINCQAFEDRPVDRDRLVGHPWRRGFEQLSSGWRVMAKNVQAGIMVCAGLKGETVSHLFMACGVLYAIDSYDDHSAKVSRAYDTYTGDSRILSLPFINRFAYNVQVLYNHRHKKLYSWDNGHQILYDVNFSF